MQRYRFPLMVTAAALAVVAVIAAFNVFSPASARAATPPWAGGWQGGPPWANHNGGAGFTLPPELAGLADLPADQRFSHFQGAQVNLTDKDGKPVAVNVTPGVATTASDTSLTITGNDGASHTYSLDSNTARPGGSTPAANDKVVVVTLNGNSTARAVVVMNGDGGGPWGGHGPMGWGH